MAVRTNKSNSKTEAATQKKATLKKNNTNKRQIQKKTSSAKKQSQTKTGMPTSNDYVPVYNDVKKAGNKPQRKPKKKKEVKAEPPEKGMPKTNEYVPVYDVPKKQLKTARKDKPANAKEQKGPAKKGQPRPTTKKQTAKKNNRPGQSNYRKPQQQAKVQKKTAPKPKAKATKPNNSITMKEEVKTAPQQKQQNKPHQKSKNEFRVFPYDQLNMNYLYDPADELNLEIERMHSIVEEFLLKEALIDEDDNILVGVSGGVDSIVLLDILANLAPKMKFNIIVCHYNHKLREFSSDRDEQFVKRVARQYHISFFSSSGNVRQYAEISSYSIEQAARSLRYKFFDKAARMVKANFLLTAHNKDEAAETFFINLFRGSGLTGLSGIPRKRKIRSNLMLIRPMLDFRKQEIINYAKLRKISWEEDETNALLYYTRNKIRHELLPLLEQEYSKGIYELINRSSKFFAGADKFITENVKRIMQQVIPYRNPGKFAIKINVLETFDEFIQGEIIQQSLTQIFKIHPIPMKMIDRIFELMGSITGSKLEINKKISVLKDREELIFFKKQIKKEVDMEIDKIGEYQVGDKKIILKKVTKRSVKKLADPNVEFIDFDLVPARLKIRTWQQGDIFQPLGMEGKMKLSDFLTNKKVSMIEKDEVLILSCQSDIIWVCGMRINHNYRLTENSKRFLKLEIIANSEKKD